MEEHRDHRPNSFTPVVVALRLAEYTIKITENPKTFPPTRTSDDGTIAVVAGGCLTEWVRELSKRIYPIRDGIRILGFTFLLTDTGKVVRLIDPKNVKHERKKLYRMAQLVRRGEMNVRKFWECYTSWKAHAALGNTWRVQMRMDQYVKSLMEGIYERNRNKDPRKDRSGERAGRSCGRAGEDRLQHHDGNAGGPV